MRGKNDEDNWLDQRQNYLTKVGNKQEWGHQESAIRDSLSIDVRGTEDAGYKLI